MSRPSGALERADELQTTTMVATDRLPASERWAALRRRWQVVIVLVALALVVELASSIIGGVSGGAAPTDERGSSYGSTATGLGAMATLLAQDGRHVQRLTTTLAKASPDRGAVLVIVDPTTWTTKETQGLQRIRSSGDSVILVGQPPKAAAAALLGTGTGTGTGAAPTWHSSGSTTRVGPTGTTGSHRFPGIGHITSTGGTFHTTASVVTLAKGPLGALAIASSARARVVLVANAHPLTNGELDRQDNAQFALDLVGGKGTTVIFDEYVHGYGRTGSGLAGLPLPWRVGLGLVILAIVVWMLSAARRFGPVAVTGRGLPPPRVAYVEAIGAGLAKFPAAQRADAAEPLLAQARWALAARLAMPADATPEAVAYEAAQAGMAPGALQALFSLPADDEQLVTAGRVATGILAGAPLADLDSQGGIR